MSIVEKRKEVVIYVCTGYFVSEKDIFVYAL